MEGARLVLVLFKARDDMADESLNSLRELLLLEDILCEQKKTSELRTIEENTSVMKVKAPCPT